MNLRDWLAYFCLFLISSLYAIPRRLEILCIAISHYRRTFRHTTCPRNGQEGALKILGYSLCALASECLLISKQGRAPCSGKQHELVSGDVGTCPRYFHNAPTQHEPHRSSSISSRRKHGHIFPARSPTDIVSLDLSYLCFMPAGEAFGH